MSQGLKCKNPIFGRTRVAQIVTAVHRDLHSWLHRPTNEPWLHTRNLVGVTYLGVKIALRKSGRK